MPKPIYLDHHATTPCEPAVVDAMVPWFTERFGNAGSSHALGVEARAAVSLARARVAALVAAEPDDVIFTSGATEANHLALQGTIPHTGRAHVITSAIEHKAVLEPLHALPGVTVTVLAPDADGHVAPEAVAGALRPDTALVSVMLANNEIGALQDVARIAAAARAVGALVHTDASQAVGRVPVDVAALGVDLMSWTAHKLYGPKGVGALWVRPGAPRVPVRALQVGGGQERGLRAGTLPVPLLVGFGVASQLAGEALVDGTPARVAALRDRLWAALRTIPGARLNGGLADRLSGNLNVAFPGCQASALLRACRGLAISSGSACSQANPKPSHVLVALGLDDATAQASLRFGVGRHTTVDDIDAAARIVTDAVAAVRLTAPRRA